MKGEDIISIFLIPPSFEALEERIRRRKTESEEVIQERLAKARREMNKFNGYDYVVVNDDVNRAANEIISIIINKIESNK